MSVATQAAHATESESRNATLPNAAIDIASAVTATLAVSPLMVVIDRCAINWLLDVLFKASILTNYTAKGDHRTRISRHTYLAIHQILPDTHGSTTVQIYQRFRIPAHVLTLRRYLLHSKRLRQRHFNNRRSPTRPCHGQLCKICHRDCCQHEYRCTKMRISRGSTATLLQAFCRWSATRRSCSEIASPSTPVSLCR